MMDKSATTLPEKLEQRLLAYTAAATAAGIGIGICAVPSSQARVIYKPVHVVLDYPSKYDLDLNGDGEKDFVLNNDGSCSYLGCLNYFDVFPALHGADGIAVNGGFRSAAAMRKGAKIGPKKEFEGCCYANLAAVSVGTSFRNSRGHWFNVTGRYLGFRFQINGKTHYGWARLNVSVNDAVIRGTLTGYAYETRADKPIYAGDTGQVPERTTLGHLTLGAATGRRAADGTNLGVH